jgi:nicotinamide-nucleotide amidase
MDKELKALIEILRENKLTLAFAESMTSGLLANEFSKQFNIGEIWLGSLVTYKEDCKKKVLGVNEDTLAKYTAESQQVTNEMVRGLKKVLDADLCVAVTGLATEGGSETKEKPVGTTFVSILFRDNIYEFRERFYGSREQVIFQACYMIFSKCLDMITKNQQHGKH